MVDSKAWNCMDYLVSWMEAEEEEELVQQGYYCNLSKTGY